MGRLRVGAQKIELEMDDPGQRTEISRVLSPFFLVQPLKRKGQPKFDGDSALFSPANRQEWQAYREAHGAEHPELVDLARSMAEHRATSERFNEQWANANPELNQTITMKAAVRTHRITESERTELWKALVENLGGLNGARVSVQQLEDACWKAVSEVLDFHRYADYLLVHR